MYCPKVGLLVLVEEGLGNEGFRISVKPKRSEILRFQQLWSQRYQKHTPNLHSPINPSIPAKTHPRLSNILCDSCYSIECVHALLLLALFFRTQNH